MGLYVEFIAPLRGGGHTRTGAPDDTLSIAGITAARLRYVDLLLFEPWQLELTPGTGFELGADKLAVHVANAASYLAQKVLTLGRRQHPAKRFKDALYIHDTLTMFGDALSHLTRYHGVFAPDHHFRAAIVPAAQQDPLGRDIRNSDNHSACSHIGQNGNAWATDVDGAGHE
jgi:hypothetical protein